MSCNAFSREGSIEMNNRPYSRSDRYGHELKKLLGEIISSELDTTKVGFSTVTEVKMTNDLRIAKVYISVLNSDDKVKDIEKFFNSRSKFLRGQLGNYLTSKSVPELRFYYDGTEAEAEKIERLISKLQSKER